MSNSQFGGLVRVITTDYSPASLDSALAGQDAVISALGWGAEHNAQTRLLTAVAVSSNSESGYGVQRFIPTEFGMPNLDIRGHPEINKMIQGRLQFREKMIQVVQDNPKLSYTGIFTSLWFDWVSGPTFSFWVSHFGRKKKVKRLNSLRNLADYSNFRVLNMDYLALICMINPLKLWILAISPSMLAIWPSSAWLLLAYYKIQLKRRTSTSLSLRTKLRKTRS